MFRWWSAETIAVVTGANRGIGFVITHQLASQGVTVILTSREVAVGEESAKVLQEGGLNVVFHQLDIVDDESISTFCAWVKENYGGIDILVSRSTVRIFFLLVPNVTTTNMLSAHFYIHGLGKSVFFFFFKLFTPKNV